MTPKLMDGRLVPSRWIMQPLAWPGQHTLIEIKEIRFNVKPSGSMFEPREKMAKPAS